MKILKVVAVVMVLFAAVFVNQAHSRTYAQASHDFYSGYYNPNHVFGIFESAPNYLDPDFYEATRMASPLYNPQYYSYDVIILVNKTDVVAAGSVREKGQRMRVYVREEALAKLPLGVLDYVNYDYQSGLLYYWKVSTARKGKVTPSGHYRVNLFSPDHLSSAYDLSPMPWAVFFNDDIASHGVSEKWYAGLGSARSAGCIRLETQRAKDLYHLIAMVGKGDVERLFQTSARFVGKTKYTYKTLYIIRD